MLTFKQMYLFRMDYNNTSIYMTLGLNQWLIPVVLAAVTVKKR